MKNKRRIFTGFSKFFFNEEKYIKGCLKTIIKEHFLYSIEDIEIALEEDEIEFIIKTYLH